VRSTPPPLGPQHDYETKAPLGPADESEREASGYEEKSECETPLRPVNKLRSDPPYSGPSDPAIGSPETDIPPKERPQQIFPPEPEFSANGGEPLYGPPEDQLREVRGEPAEIDSELDPLQEPPGLQSEACDYATLSLLIPRCHVETQRGEALKEGVREILDQMQNPPKDFSETAKANESFLNSIGKHVHDSEAFVAGSFQNAFPAWEELLRESRRQSSRKVLKWIKDGVRPIFEGVQNTEPAKLNRVRGLIRHAVPRGQVEAFLKGVLPHEIEIQNHRSTYQHWPFTVDVVKQLVVSGTAHLYGPTEGKPKVVNPLGVALNGDKERLVLNMMYPNSFMKQLPFRYERLRDVLTFLKRGGFISSWDLKSGYFHVLIHPRFRTYFGFRIGDAYLHFNAMCFGWMQACYVFTVVMQEVFLEVRARSIPVSSYIDDGLTADMSYERCLSAVVLLVKLLNLLGAFFGLPKCHFLPSQKGDWLGFEIISPNEIFRASDKKMHKVKTALIRFLALEEVTPCQLVAIAGKLISLSPAVLPASLYSRAFFEAIQGKASWDELFPSSLAVNETVKEWLDNLDAWNGRRWYARPISLCASSDASDFGFGELVTLPDGREIPVSGNLTEAEITMSSTAREIIGFLRLLQATARLFPDTIRDSTVQLVGDHQGAVQAIN
jgi:hypothetical protein